MERGLYIHKGTELVVVRACRFVPFCPPPHESTADGTLRESGVVAAVLCVTEKLEMSGTI